MSLSRRHAWLAPVLVPASVMTLLLAACSAGGSVEHETGGDSSIRSGNALNREAMSASIDAMVTAGRFKGELWRSNLAERASAPVSLKWIALDGDLVVCQDEKHQVHAIDRATGTHRFIIQLPGPITQTVGGTGSTLTFVSTDEVVAVDRLSGARSNGTRSLPRAHDHLGFFPTGRAVTIGATTYIGRLAPTGVQAFGLTSGNDGWEYMTQAPVVDVAAYGDGAVAQVLAITESGVLVSLPPRPAHESTWSPPENWIVRTAGTRIVTPFAVANESLIFGTANGFLLHVDARGGSVRWKVGCGLDMQGRRALVAGGGVYQQADGNLHAFDLATGAELWKLTSVGRAITRVGDRVYVERGPEGNVVDVVDAMSGKKLSSFSSQGFKLPTVHGGGMLIASDATNLFALE